jgi:RimJ/RimL family protein N-acetyltransferase
MPPPQEVVTSAPVNPLSLVPSPSGPVQIDWSAGLPTLKAGDVLLREPRLSDARPLFENLATDQVARFMSRPPKDSSGFERFIAWIQEQRRQGRCLCYGIVPGGSDEAVGLIQVRQLEPGFGSAEWGFALGHRFWGTGIFPAAARATVDFVFRHVGAYRLEARSSTENGRGNGALRKLGATAEGVLRKSLLGAEWPMDQLLWSMHSDEWLRSHTQSYELAPPCDPDDPPVFVPGGAPASPGTTVSWRLGLPTIETSECLLRDLRATDAAELLRTLNHPDVERFIPPSPSTVEGFEQFIAWAHRQREGGRYACFAVVPNGAIDAIGIFQIRQLDPSFLTAEWGFVLGKRFWGSGIFAAAAVAILDFAFDTIGIHRLEARAATGNSRGNGALRKVGATLEGQLRRSFLLGGVYHDDALWALLADDWRRSREQFLLDRK